MSDPDVDVERALRAENAELLAERDMLRGFAAWVEFHASHVPRKSIVEYARRALRPIGGSVRTIGRVPGQDTGIDVWVPDSPKEGHP